MFYFSNKIDNNIKVKVNIIKMPSKKINVTKYIKQLSLMEKALEIAKKI